MLPIAEKKSGFYMQIKGLISVLSPFGCTCFDQLDDLGHPEIYSNKTTTQHEDKTTDVLGRILPVFCRP